MESVKKQNVKKELETTKVITIKGDKFTFDIKTVTVDQFLIIETEKQRISGGSYNQLVASNTVNAFNAATLIDMISIFRVLMPDIENSLPDKDFSKLSMVDTNELVVIYRDQFMSWYNQWQKVFNKPYNQDSEQN